MRSRVTLNALALRPGGSGVQTYIRELIRALPASVDADLDALVQDDALVELPVGVAPRPVPVVAGWRRAWAGVRSVCDTDLVHGLDVTLPWRSSVPRVATFHDLAVFDVPWAFPRATAAAKRLLARHSARVADEIVAVSAFTAERIRSRFGRDAVVTTLAPPSDCGHATPEVVASVRARHELPERFVLFVGTVEPRKDVASLAAACERLGVPLVVAGALSAGGSPLRAQLLGYVERADLLALYGASTLFAYPSRYEGFGLPVLEAIACGTAVVTTTVGSLPELLGEAAVLVAPGDIDGLAAAIRDVWHDAGRRDELVAAGTERVRTMGWTQTAAATAAVYRSLGIG